MLVKKAQVSTVSKGFSTATGVEQLFLCQAGDVVCISEAV